MSSNIFNMDKDEFLKSLTGKGVKVGIIDSGIEASHDVFKDSDVIKGGVVIEFHGGLPFPVCGHVGIPVDGAPEVLHGWNEAVVLHLEGGGYVVALETGAAHAF